MSFLRRQMSPRRQFSHAVCDRRTCSLPAPSGPGPFRGIRIEGVADSAFLVALDGLVELFDLAGVNRVFLDSIVHGANRVQNG